ncbi:MAG: MFS transporter [Planctomycetota bacterium]|nr:MFS transporter [Planctomycetales bacterium]RLT11549.1 MAG: MFS transporter [Planctomycetota bacterium]
MTRPTNDQTPTNIRWLIVAMLMGFTFLGHFNRVGITVVANEIFIGPGLLSEVQMGKVYSAFLWVYTLCMLPGGWMIDWIGPRRALTAMGLGMGLCVVLTGAIGELGLPIASLLIPLIVVRAIAGFFSTPLHPGAARSVSLWLPLTSRSTANGLVTAGALLGLAVTAPGFGWLMDQFNWAWAFVISGGAMMAFSVVWFVLATDDVLGHPRANAAEKKLVAWHSVPPSGTRASINDFGSLFRNRGLVVLAASYAAYSYFQYLFFYWIDFYFGKELKLPEGESRRATFIVMIAMAVGMAIGGLLTDRLSRRLGVRGSCRSIAITGMLLSAVFAWFGVAAKDPDDVILLFSLALAALGMCEGIFWTTATALEPTKGGLAGAFLNTIGNAGGSLAPICTPWVGTHYGWPTAIGVACCTSVIGAILWLWIDAGAKQISQVAVE